MFLSFSIETNFPSTKPTLIWPASYLSFSLFVWVSECVSNFVCKSDNNMLHVMVYHFVSFVVAKCFDTISLHPFPSRSVFYSRTDKSVRTNHSKCMLRIYSTDSICCSEKLNFIRNTIHIHANKWKTINPFSWRLFYTEKKKKKKKNNKRNRFPN